MGLTLDNLMLGGLLMAFILPALGAVMATLPSPTTTTGINLSRNLSSTGIFVSTALQTSVQSQSRTLLGNNCFGNGTVAKSCNTTGGSFSANPTIFQAFAFVVSNLGTIMLDIIQLPYVDYVALQAMIGGMASILPIGVLGFVEAGSYLLYLYMAFSMLMLGVSMIQKYSVKNG